MEELTHIILEFYDKLSSWEHEIVRESKISLSQMHTLEVIGYYGRAKSRDIAKKIGVTTGTLTVMLHTLEKKGYIKKETNPEDSRSIHISLTDEGNSLYEEHHKYHHEMLTEICNQCTESEINTLKDIMIKINNSF